MSRPILLRKQLGALRPYDDAAREALAKVKDGEVVRADIRRPRSIQHHRWWWTFLTLIWEGQETYATKEDLHAAIKVAVGLGHTVKLPDGRVILVPGSTSFAAMDEARFQEYTDRAIKLACERIIPGLDEGALRDEIEAMLGEGRAA